MKRGWLSEKTFSEVIAALPLVSIDLCVVSGDCILLGKRNNEPAKDWWFTPGGRVFKNEPVNAAVVRIASDELGDQAFFLSKMVFMGVWDHFYDNSVVDDNVSTHYINLPHYCVIGKKQKQYFSLPKGVLGQHSDWRWQSLKTVSKEKGVHLYVQKYCQWLTDNVIA